MNGHWSSALFSLVLSMGGAGFTTCAWAESGRLQEHSAQGVRLADGFEITEIAGPEFANDIWSLTIDPRGRIVVAGPGYIRILHDANGDRLIDHATLFAKHSGAMGLCYNESGTELFVMGGGWLARLRDSNQDGVADGPPENILPFAAGEHGGHAIRQGPDGWWYVIGGNDAGIDGRHDNTTERVIDRVEAGALLRISADLKQREVIAHGFRNPYDFDFNAAGDLFTYDSDTERDYFLPWYSPCRIYQIHFAQHHGWRLKGYQRSLRRSDDYPDIAPALTPLGRGSPTGVVCYRHVQFPEEYRGGLFACDWTFGRIHFIGLAPNGAGYMGTPRVFLEPIGSHGFAPTDCAVAPDGSLIVTIGGRKTRGSVYRIRSRAGKESAATGPSATASDELAAVLRAPQPLDAWSRARWMPVARQLERAPFEKAVRDSTRSVTERIRAIEILTELFQGVETHGAIDDPPDVSARLLWSAARTTPHGGAGVQASDSRNPRVQAAAAEAAIARASPADPVIDLAALSSDDRRVRNAAITALAKARALHPDKQAIPHVAGTPPKGDYAQVKARLAWMRAGLLKRNSSGPAVEELKELTSFLRDGKSDELFLEVLRVIQLCLGDWRVDSPSAEAFSAYETRWDFPDDDPLRAKLLEAARSLIGVAGARVSEECGRLCAMLRDDAPEVSARILRMINRQSSATSDWHYLAVIARLRDVLSPELAAEVAAAIVGLDAKLAGGDRRPKQNWPVRLAEVVEALVHRQVAIAEALLQTPGFATPARLAFVQSLGPAHRERAARLYLAGVKKDPQFEWSPALVALLRTLPDADVDALIKAHTAKAPPARVIRPEDVARWEKMLEIVAWAGGDAKAGEKIFRERSCATCHGGAISFGPDLALVARRFAPRDLMRTVLFPSRDVAETYRAMNFHLRDGSVRTGIVAFHSADGVIVQTGPGVTERIAEGDILSREPSTLSLMPEGLLEGLNANDLADLHAFLTTL